MMDATTDLVSRRDADPRLMASKKRHRNRPTSPPQSDCTVIAPTTTTDNEEEEENEDTDQEEVEENEGSDSDGSDVGEIEEECACDELEELNPSAIQRCRTRGVRVDYTSPEALEKAGLTTEYYADSEDEDAMIEGGCADSEDEDFRMWED
ncbi:hypothetical protein B0H14DRAFT_3873159 [Mycena olivaceomarginata]|nr:hypothetical protein B0H14DRAFT_3873159 [Mycena olivaceomarginata]